MNGWDGLSVSVRYPVFMDWKTSYCYDGKTTQRDLKSQCNPYKNPQVLCFALFFVETKSDTKIRMESQETQNIQSNL